MLAINVFSSAAEAQTAAGKLSRERQGRIAVNPVPVTIPRQILRYFDA